MAEQDVFFRRNDTSICVEVVGRGTFQCATALREILGAQIDDGVRNFCFDLEQCTCLDSTFMGLLATLVVRHRGEGVKVALIHTSEDLFDQLDGLGLCSLFEFSNGDWDHEADGIKRIALLDEVPDRGVAKDVLIESHEALGVANPENVGRFKQVLQCLRS
jgi:anti-anti-sigma regulatory factor